VRLSALSLEAAEELQPQEFVKSRVEQAPLAEILGLRAVTSSVEELRS